MTWTPGQKVKDTERKSPQANRSGEVEKAREVCFSPGKSWRNTGGRREWGKHGVWSLRFGMGVTE